MKIFKQPNVGSIITAQIRQGRVDILELVGYHDIVIVSLYLLSQKVSIGFYMLRHIIPRF